MDTDFAVLKTFLALPKGSPFSERDVRFEFTPECRLIRVNPWLN